MVFMIIKYRNQDLGLLFLRLCLSLIFFFSGIAKITGLAGSVKFFSSIGLGVPILCFVIVVELIAGIVFLLGIFSEWGYVIAIEMALIIVKLNLPHGGFDSSFLALTMLAAALAIALAGPGKYSLEAKLMGLATAAK
jgi:putative oxidoreductase